MLAECVTWLEENRVLVLEVLAQSAALLLRAENGEICQPLLVVSYPIHSMRNNIVDIPVTLTVGPWPRMVGELVVCRVRGGRR